MKRPERQTVKRSNRLTAKEAEGQKLHPCFFHSPLTTSHLPTEAHA